MIVTVTLLKEKVMLYWLSIISWFLQLEKLLEVIYIYVNSVKNQPELWA